MLWANGLGQNDALGVLRSCPKSLGQILSKSQEYAIFSQNPNLVDSEPLSLLKWISEDQMLIVDEDDSFEMKGEQNPNWLLLVLMSDSWLNPAESQVTNTSYAIC